MKYISNLIFQASQESKKVQQFIEEVVNKIELHLAENNEAFLDELGKNLKRSDIADARVILYEESSIVEYDFEPKKDFISIIINDSLENNENSEISIGNLPIFDIDNVQKPEKRTSDTENKTQIKYTNAEGTEFSMQRLAPGYLLFTSKFSFAVKDEENMESESVIGTAIFLSLLHSNDEVRHQLNFKTSFTDKENYLKLKREQSDLVNKLANEEIDFDTWQKLDDEYKQDIIQAKQKLDEGF